MKLQSALFLNCLIFMGCFTDPGSKNHHQINGLVVYQGQPIHQAKVYLEGNETISTTTDAQGNFSLRNVPAGEQAILVKKSFDDQSEVTLREVVQVLSDLRLDLLVLPDPIRLVSVKNTEKRFLMLVWNSSKDANFREYKIYRHFNTGIDELNGTLIHVSTDRSDTSFLDELNLMNGDKAYYRVFVMNDFGKIGGSNISMGNVGEPDISISDYNISKVRNIGVPKANPVGLASDGFNVWLMFGDHNASEHTLIYYDMAEYKVLKAFTYKNLIEVLGTGVYGITWDGAAVWISVSGNTNKLVKVNPENGDIIKTWSNPTTLGPSDLDWYGEYLWVSSGTGEISKLNPIHGGSERIIDLDFSRRNNGIAVRADIIWLADLFSNDLHVYKIDKTYLGKMENVLSDGQGPMCFHKDELAVLTNAGITFYKISPKE